MRRHLMSVLLQAPTDRRQTEHIRDVVRRARSATSRWPDARRSATAALGLQRERHENASDERQKTAPRYFFSSIARRASRPSGVASDFSGTMIFGSASFGGLSPWKSKSSPPAFLIASRSASGESRPTSLSTVFRLRIDRARDARTAGERSAGAST